MEWSTCIDLGSDHLPISVTFVDKTESSARRTRLSYANYNKADWSLFKSELEKRVRRLGRPGNCKSGEIKFRKAVLSASKKAIPSDFRKDFEPGLPSEAVDLRKQVNVLRATNPRDSEISGLNRQINEIIDKNARDTWRQEVEEADPKTSSSKFFSLLRKLSGKSKRQSPNQPIRFGN